jgi:hypothetical protein
MREQLILAEVEDDSNDINHSKQIADSINKNHSNLVALDDLNNHRHKLVTEEDINKLEGQDKIDSTVKDDAMEDNFEYKAMINALDGPLSSASKEIR